MHDKLCAVAVATTGFLICGVKRWGKVREERVISLDEDASHRAASGEANYRLRDLDDGQRKTGVGISTSLRGRLCAALAALTLLCAPLLLVGCAANSYAGISFAPGAADVELQALARRAQVGDKQAQLELGIRYEEGLGVSVNLLRAEWLYMRAAFDNGGTTLVYVPAAGGGTRAATVPVNSGPATAGLPEARARWLALVSTHRAVRR